MQPPSNITNELVMYNLLKIVYGLYPPNVNDINYPNDKYANKLSITRCLHTTVDSIPPSNEMSMQRLTPFKTFNKEYS